MNKLKNILAKYSSADRRLGTADIESNNLSESQQINLRHDLENISSKNGKIFWIIIVAILILFILSILLVAYNQNDPDKIKAIFSITGISVMGLIYYMVKIWKEKNYIDMTLALVSTLDKQMINSILSVILAKISS